MKLFGLNERQLLLIAIGHICLVEVLLQSAPSFIWAFLGGALWTGMAAGIFIRRNLKDARQDLKS